MFCKRCSVTALDLLSILREEAREKNDLGWRSATRHPNTERSERSSSFRGSLAWMSCDTVFQVGLAWHVLISSLTSYVFYWHAVLKPSCHKCALSLLALALIEISLATCRETASCQQIVEASNSLIRRAHKTSRKSPSLLGLNRDLFNVRVVKTPTFVMQVTATL